MDCYMRLKRHFQFILKTVATHSGGTGHWFLPMSDTCCFLFAQDTFLEKFSGKIFSKTQLNDSAYFIHTESGILLFGIRLYCPLAKSFRNRQIYSVRLWIAPNRIEGSPLSPQLIQRSSGILEKCG